jgi:hypothetical protein
MQTFTWNPFQILCIRTNAVVLGLCMWALIQVGFPHNPQRIRGRSETLGHGLGLCMWSLIQVGFPHNPQRIRDRSEALGHGLGLCMWALIQVGFPHNPQRIRARSEALGHGDCPEGHTNTL